MRNAKFRADNKKYLPKSTISGWYRELKLFFFREREFHFLILLLIQAVLNYYLHFFHRLSSLSVDMEYCFRCLLMLLL